jgi:hypothetical protein
MTTPTDDELEELRQAWQAWYGDTGRAMPTDPDRLRLDVTGGLDCTAEEAAGVVRPEME